MSILDQVIAKVSRRFIPFLIWCYFLSYLDRVNIGFAALTMNKDIGLSSTAFGLGASIFFLGYFLFEVPSNLILEKTGARIWIARIMITWGILSIGHAFIWNDTSFYALRFIFGVAEAGFFPGIILYLTYWFPSRSARSHHRHVHGGSADLVPDRRAPLELDPECCRGRVLAASRAGNGCSSSRVCRPFITGFIVLAYLTDSPKDATWLKPEERRLAHPATRRRARQQGGHSSLHAERSAYPSARAGAGAGLLRHCDRPLQPRALAAADRQEFWCQHHADGIAHSDPGAGSGRSP